MAAQRFQSHTCGLRNVGNTCYLNSAAQCMSNVGPLRNLLLVDDQQQQQQQKQRQEEAEEEEKAMVFMRRVLVEKWNQWGEYGDPHTRQEWTHRERLKMVLLLQSAVEVMWRTEQPSTNIKKFVDQFWKLYPRYGGYTQQDSMEFIRIVLDNLHEEFKSVRSKVREHKGTSLESISSASPTLTGSSINEAVFDKAMKEQVDDNDTDQENGVDDDENGETMQGSDDNVKSDAENNSDDDTTSNESQEMEEVRRMEDVVLSDPKLAVDDNDEFEGYDPHLRQFLTRLHEKNLLSDAKSMLEKHESLKAGNPAISGHGRTSSVDVDVEPVLNDTSLSQDDKLEEVMRILSDRRKREPASEISRIFGGLLLSEVECEGCDNVSQTVDSFFDISLSIPDMRARHELARKGKRQKHGQMSQSGQHQKMKKFLCNAYFSAKTQLFGCFETVFSTFVDNNDITPLSSCTMSDVLDNFFIEDTLTGANKYHCEHCKCLQNGVKRFSLLHMPQVLVVHLKRFGYHSLFARKISTHVKFDEYLTVPKRYVKDYVNDRHSSTRDISDEMPAAAATTSNTFTESHMLNEDTAPLSYGTVENKSFTPDDNLEDADECNGHHVDGSNSSSATGSHGSDKRLEINHSGDEIVYRLRAIVVHHGNYQLGGHYVSYIRGSNNQWYHCNDSTVTPVDFDAVRRSQAYVLFYERESRVANEEGDA